MERAAETASFRELIALIGAPRRREPAFWASRRGSPASVGSIAPPGRLKNAQTPYFSALAPAAEFDATQSVQYTVLTTPRAAFRLDVGTSGGVDEKADARII